MPSTPGKARTGAAGLLDVADRASVSGATVSRCFNHPDQVRPQTRQRILTAASELGYIRDRAAGALHGGSSGTVGLIVPTIDNAIFSELIEAFSAQLSTHDRTMLIASNNYDPDYEVTLIRSLLERRIDAIAFIGRDRSDAAMEMLQVRNVPTITLWDFAHNTSVPCIGCDNESAARQITQHIIELGHKNIALMFPEAHFNDRARDRKHGALKALDQAGIEVPDHWNLHCPYDAAMAKTMATELLQDRTNAPSAIICANDIIAYGVIFASQKLQLTVPDDISVVGIGDFKHSSCIEPNLTTVRLPAQRIGRMAADTLNRLLTEPDASPIENINFPTELIIRDSTGANRR